MRDRTPNLRVFYICIFKNVCMFLHQNVYLNVTTAGKLLTFVVILFRQTVVRHFWKFIKYTTDLTKRLHFVLYPCLYKQLSETRKCIVYLPRPWICSFKYSKKHRIACNSSVTVVYHKQSSTISDVYCVVMGWLTNPSIFSALALWFKKSVVNWRINNFLEFWCVGIEHEGRRLFMRNFYIPELCFIFYLTTLFQTFVLQNAAEYWHTHVHM